jgi:hypothetical protein
MALQQNNQDAWRVAGFRLDIINIHELTGNITDCEMSLYMLTAENTITYQYNFFILQDAIHDTVTIQNNRRHNETVQIYCTLHKDDAIYSTFNIQSSPVHLSCPPEYRQLSVLLTGEQLVQTLTKVCHTLLHVGRSWPQHGCEIFLRRVIFSTFCKSEI